MRLPQLGRFLAVSGIALMAHTGTATADASRSQRFLAAALEELKEGDEASAIIQLRNAIQQDPENLDARFLLGRLHLQSGNPLSAEKELRYVFDRRRTDETEILLGRALLAARKTEDVFKVLSPSAAKPDDAQRKALLRGDAHFALGQMADAEAVFASVAAEDPRAIPAHLGLARLALVRGDRKGAADRVARILAIDPKSIDGQALRAEMALMENRMEEAKAAVDELVALAPASRPAQQLRIQYLLQSGRMDEAEAKIREAAAGEPKEPMLRYLLATVHAGKQRFREAEAELAAIQPLVEAFPPAQLLEGMVKFQLGQFSQAERFLQRYANAIPGNLAARRLLALVQMRGGNLTSAAATLDKILTDRPDDVQSLQLLAGLEMRRGDHDAAARIYQRIAENGNREAAFHAQGALTLLGEGKGGDAAGDEAISRDIVAILELTRQRDFETALQRLRPLREQRPDDLTLMNLEGGVLFAKGDRAAARALVEEAFRRDRRFLAALDSLDRIDTIEGRRNLVEERMRNALTENPDDERMILRLANFLEEERRMDEAVHLVEEARQRLGKSVPLRLALVSAYRARGEQAKIPAIAEELSEIALENTAVYRNAADAYLAAGQPARAAAMLAKLAELDPTSARIQVDLGRMHMTANDFGKARAALKRAQELAPADAAAASLLADIAMKEGKAKEALAVADALAKQDTTSGARLRAAIELRDGRARDAVATLEKAFAASPSSSIAIELAEARRQAGDRDGAIAGLQAWLDKQSGDIAVRRILAEMVLDAGRLPEAAAEYRRLVADRPNDPDLLNNLAWVEHQLGNPEALGLAERAHAQAPASPLIADTYGWILVKQGQAKRGAEILGEAARRAPDRSDIQYRHAYALNAAGKPAEARAILERIAAGPAFAEKPEAEALLAKLAH